MKPILWPDRKLSQKAKEVTFEEAKNLFSVARTLLRDSGRKAIALPEFGIPYSCIVVNTPHQESLVIFNPVYLHKALETETVLETCACMPGIKQNVKRAKSILLGSPENNIGFDESEPALCYEVQHAMDHLDGITILDNAPLKVKDKAVIAIRKSLLRRS